VGLKQCQLSLVSTIMELLERESSGSSLENKQYGGRDPPCLPCGTFYLQKVGTNFADMRRSYNRHSSFADSGHGVLFSQLIGVPN
jgi:hypothetical protein